MRYKFPYRFARAIDPQKTGLSLKIDFGVSAVVPFISAFDPSWSHAATSIAIPQILFGNMGCVNLNCYDRIPREKLPETGGLRIKKVDGKENFEWFSEPVPKKDVYFENGLVHGIGLAVSCASYGLGYLARNLFVN